MPGSVLLIDLWSVYSGPTIALLSLGVKFYVLAARSNPDVVKMEDATIDQMVHVPAAECVNAEMVRGLNKKRTIQTILVGGGSPCQGNTFVNKGRKGLADPRSQQPKELVRIRDELKAAFPNIAVLIFLENVASSPRRSSRSTYDLLMGVKPVSINAVIFGWVGRRRLYWAAGPHGEDVGWNDQALPENVTMTWESDRSVIHYAGKPIPRHIRTNDGYALQNKKPEQVVRDGGKGAVFPFTREFHHPDDGNRELWEVIQRWQQDGKRFPAGAHAEENLLWRGRDWRIPTSAERAQAHGCPPAAVRPDRMDNIQSKDAERVAHCAVPRQWLPHPLYDVGLHAPPPECSSVEPDPLHYDALHPGRDHAPTASPGNSVRTPGTARHARISHSRSVHRPDGIHFQGLERRRGEPDRDTPMENHQVVTAWSGSSCTFSTALLGLRYLERPRRWPHGPTFTISPGDGPGVGVPRDATSSWQEPSWPRLSSATGIRERQAHGVRNGIAVSLQARDHHGPGPAIRCLHHGGLGAFHRPMEGATTLPAHGIRGGTAAHDRGYETAHAGIGEACSGEEEPSAHRALHSPHPMA